MAGVACMIIICIVTPLVCSYIVEGRALLYLSLVQVGAEVIGSK